MWVNFVKSKFILTLPRILFPALPANGGPVHVYPQSHYKDIARTSEEAQEFIEGLEVEDPNM